MNIIVKIKMEKDKKLKQKRLRLKPSHRWTESQSLQLLQAVSDAIKDSPESFEKPTSQRFYEKLQQNTPALQSVVCVAMKSKMRYLKALYVAAAAWKNKTGSGLLANGDESSVSAHVNKICPNFDLLEVIFGQRKNVNPGVIFESTDSIEVLADSPCADSSLNDTIDSYDLCALDCEDLVDPILPISISSDCSAAAAATSTPQSSLDFRSSTKKPKRKSEAPFNKLIFIQEKRLELEVKKIELEKEKEKNEVELKRIELNNQLEMKRIETESEKETKLEIEKLKLASEERIKMFEIELKLKSK